jgi:DNA-binding response OmpR family regulator
MNKILVVDDEKPIRILYEEELTEEGYEVITKGDGTGLLHFIEEGRFDLVILDIRLPRHDGLDLLQDIRNTFYDLPVILCTAYPSFKHDLRSIAADHYVVKGSDMRELKLKVKMALESRPSLMDTTTSVAALKRKAFLNQQIEL